MGWYSVRCVLEWSARGVFEERVTLWQAESHEEAISRAEAEVRDYASDVEMKYTGLAQSFELYATPRDGAEVFSLMRASELDSQSYISRFFDTGRERLADVAEDSAS